MKPDVRAKPKSTSVMTSPRNQSAFQNAVFMNPPLSVGILRRSASEFYVFSYTLRAGELGQLRGDDEVLDRHALRLEKRSLFGTGAALSRACDDLAQLDQRTGMQAPFLEGRQDVSGFLDRRGPRVHDHDIAVAKRRLV